MDRVNRQSRRPNFPFIAKNGLIAVCRVQTAPHPMSSQQERHQGRSRQSTSDVDREYRLWTAFVISLCILN
jgi:hypothetical protein